MLNCRQLSLNQVKAYSLRFSNQREQVSQKRKWEIVLNTFYTPYERSHRPKCLLTADDHITSDVGQDSRLEEVTSKFMPLTTF